tara:strand:- start:256 stop:429 length:174 start_codon:yes stop_codon:yes gene_type:complete
MQIVVKVKNVYGNELIYPVCEHAEMVTELTGTKTLSQRNIATLKRLGFEFIVESQKL